MSINRDYRVALLYENINIWLGEINISLLWTFHSSLTPFFSFSSIVMCKNHGTLHIVLVMQIWPLNRYSTVIKFTYLWLFISNSFQHRKKTQSDRSINIQNSQNCKKKKKVYSAKQGTRPFKVRKAADKTDTNWVREHSLLQQPDIWASK